MAIEDTEDMDLSKWSSFILKLGFPIVVAGGLIWFLVTTVNVKLNTIGDAVTAHSTESKELRNSVDALKNSQDGSKNEQAKTNLILQQICVNGSSLRDRTNCFR
jgi:hypothetical protein